MFLNVFDIKSADMAIDLGTSNTLVYVRGSGIVLNEASVVAIQEIAGNKQVLAVGNEARQMIGRAPPNIATIRPLRNGVIADFEIAEKMIKYFIRKVHKRRSFISPKMIICVSSGATAVEKRAIVESAQGAGASQVVLIEKAIAAAIGAGLLVTGATGSMIVDIGGGTTEVAVIALGDVVYAKSIRIGGDQMDEAIVAYHRRVNSLLIGESSAKRIKKEIGSVIYPVEGDGKTTIACGRNLMNGIPKEIMVTERQMVDALSESIDAIIESIKIGLENTPPEISADIIDNGIVLTGGGALLPNIDVAIKNATGLKVTIAHDPITCVARGAGQVLEEIKTFKNLPTYVN